MRKVCDSCGCYWCDCGKPIVQPKQVVKLTERQICRIRLEAWNAYFANAFPMKVGIIPNPFTEIKLDEYTKRLYIIDNGTRRLHGAKRNGRTRKSVY